MPLPIELKRARVDDARTLVLVQNQEGLFVVGIAGTEGHMTEDALHAALETAEADFLARCAAFGIASA